MSAPFSPRRMSECAPVAPPKPKIVYESPRLERSDSSLFGSPVLNRPDERWQYLADQAGTNMKDVYVVPQNSTPQALESGMPSQLAGRIKTLHLPSSCQEEDNSLPLWLNTVCSKFSAVEHLHVGGAEKAVTKESVALLNDLTNTPEADARLRRLYVIFRLPQLKSVDGTPVSFTERLWARPESRKDNSLIDEAASSYEEGVDASLSGSKSESGCLGNTVGMQPHVNSLLEPYEYAASVAPSTNVVGCEWTCGTLQFLKNGRLGDLGLGRRPPKEFNRHNRNAKTPPSLSRNALLKASIPEDTTTDKVLRLRTSDPRTYSGHHILEEQLSSRKPVQVAVFDTLESNDSGSTVQQPAAGPTQEDLFDEFASAGFDSPAEALAREGPKLVANDIDSSELIKLPDQLSAPSSPVQVAVFEVEGSPEVQTSQSPGQVAVRDLPFESDGLEMAQKHIEIGESRTIHLGRNESQPTTPERLKTSSSLSPDVSPRSPLASELTANDTDMKADEVVSPTAAVVRPALLPRNFRAFFKTSPAPPTASTAPCSEPRKLNPSHDEIQTPQLPESRIETPSKIKSPPKTGLMPKASITETLIIASLERPETQLPEPPPIPRNSESLDTINPPALMSPIRLGRTNSSPAQIQSRNSLPPPCPNRKFFAPPRIKVRQRREERRKDRARSLSIIDDDDDDESSASSDCSSEDEILGVDVLP